MLDSRVVRLVSRVAHERRMWKTRHAEDAVLAASAEHVKGTQCLGAAFASPNAHEARPFDDDLFLDARQLHWLEHAVGRARSCGKAALDTISRLEVGLIALGERSLAVSF